MERQGHGHNTGQSQGQVQGRKDARRKTASGVISAFRVKSSSRISTLSTVTEHSIDIADWWQSSFPRPTTLHSFHENTEDTPECGPSCGRKEEKEEDEDLQKSKRKKPKLSQVQMDNFIRLKMSGWLQKVRENSADITRHRLRMIQYNTKRVSEMIDQETMYRASQAMDKLRELSRNVSTEKKLGSNLRTHTR